MIYKLFTPEEAKQYVLTLGLFHDTQSVHLTAEEIGDGNLNYVFRIQDKNAARGIILKQAVPYARCVGESWPLNLDRSRIEAEVSLTHSEFCQEHMVKVHHYNKDLALVVMEDLSDHTILRAAMLERKKFPFFPKHIGSYFAKVLFYTSDFHMDQQNKKRNVVQFMNPELCKITEDLFFADPYHGHERNHFNPLVAEEVENLYENHEIKLAVAKLKYKFLTHTQALLHGDVHTGSIFIQQNSTKLIDAEFGFYGPIGFDVGSLIGNFILNYYAQPWLESGFEKSETDSVNYQHYILQSIQEIWQEFFTQFSELLRTKTTDINFKNLTYQQYFLASILQDTLGYAGTELIRRTIGLAHVNDFKSIANEKNRAVCEKQALQLGQFLLLNSENLTLQDVCRRMSY